VRRLRTKIDPATRSTTATQARPQGETLGIAPGGGAQVSPQSWSASDAQVASQLTSQQKASWAHTTEQQDSSWQEGEPFAVQQSPTPSQVTPLQDEGEQSSSAASAQIASQLLLQQEPSWAQTSSQQGTSSQAGVPLSAQQSPGPGHVLPLQTVHSVAALLAQVASQALKQQKGSRSQIC
jgi:hypothetical protein